MKIKTLIAFLSVILFITQAHGETNGYFSFAFTKGQERNDASMDMFHDVQLGLLFSGVISKRLDYLAEIGLKEEATVNIDQAWVRLSMSDAFNLKMGVYLVPCTCAGTLRGLNRGFCDVIGAIASGERYFGHPIPSLRMLHIGGCVAGERPETRSAIRVNTSGWPPPLRLPRRALGPQPLKIGWDIDFVDDLLRHLD